RKGLGISRVLGWFVGFGDEDEKDGGEAGVRTGRMPVPLFSCSWLIFRNSVRRLPLVRAMLNLRGMALFKVCFTSGDRSARCYAGGDTAARRPYLGNNFDQSTQ